MVPEVSKFQISPSWSHPSLMSGPSIFLKPLKSPNKSSEIADLTFLKTRTLLETLQSLNHHHHHHASPIIPISSSSNVFCQSSPLPPQFLNQLIFKNLILLLKSSSVNHFQQILIFKPTIQNLLQSQTDPIRPKLRSPFHPHSEPTQKSLSRTYYGEG